MTKHESQGFNDTESFITGIVTSVNVKGFGSNSAQLLFTICSGATDEERAIVVQSDYEPQVFAGMAAFVTAAHFSREQITAGYVTGSGETNRAIEVFSPARNSFSVSNLENYEGSVKRSQDGKEYVYDPVNGKYVPVVDATQQIKEMTDKTSPNKEEVKAFLRKRISMLRDSPHLNEAEKARRITDIEGQANIKEAYEEFSGDPPPPGGVGFGVFYKPGELGFTRSAKLHHHIICPAMAGGDNANYLYLTATNRTAKGVEAFVLYFAQESARFRVFDWARPEADHWQVVIENAQLQPYLGTLAGRPYIGVINSTELLRGTTWRNSVLLFNNTTNNYDEIYRFDYTLGSNDEQHDAFYGSWAPIVETFQDKYGPELNAMGCFYTFIFLDDAVNTLYDSNTTLRNDNVGIESFELQPNHSYLAH